jgi:deazaflavin-dependent oxidoreductase (nitroreductase family)
MTLVFWFVLVIIAIFIIWAIWRRWRQAVGMRKGDTVVIDNKRRSNKLRNNKIVMNILGAGKRCSFFALVKHTGRKTGRQFVTPVRLVQQGDRFTIPLTYGENTDWYKNLMACGSMELQWHGVSYRVGKPELMQVSSAMSDFPLISQVLFLLDGLTAFVRVTKLPKPE